MAYFTIYIQPLFIKIMGPISDQNYFMIFSTTN